ncbi:MAG TPA: lysine--tRNA ligase [Actinomycetota bacterium]|nr:lysine--tRNA ligase [Actinomycetota bacterium]
MSDAGAPETPEERPEDVLAVRRQKLERLRERGIEPFARRYEPDARAADLQERFLDLEAGASSGERARVAGRLHGLRRLGKLWFGVLRDGSGEIQLMLDQATLGAEAWALLDDLDVGDWVGAEGEVIRSRRGELSVRASELSVLAKSLRPMPEKWHGLRDVELRMRQRYLDLATNDEARSMVRRKAAMLRALRGVLDARGFLEVETPIVQTIPGGGLARPFETFHEALGIPMFLRIAPELYLKRLLVGGFDRVYEIGRNFRNEGISPQHNPEFTMLEAYEAFGTYEDMMDLLEELVRAAADGVNGSLVFTFRGESVDLAQPFRRATLAEMVSEALHHHVTIDTSIMDLQKLAGRHGMDADPDWGPGKLMLEIFEKLVEPKLIEPTFVRDFPREVSPLARSHRDDPRLTEHVDLILGGVEIAPAYSELNDPDEQRSRFELQMQQKAAGAEETHPYDEEFIVALEHGMPPAGGLGLGVDRLLAVLTDAPSLREVIIFPALRPEA